MKLVVDQLQKRFGTQEVLRGASFTFFDVVVADEMKALLRRIKTRHIILLSTHIMDLALDLCDDIVILHHGVLQEVRREDLADEAYKDRIIAALKEEPDVV